MLSWTWATRPYKGVLVMFPSSPMMIMMSGITKVFNKSAKRNFHQRESHDDDKIATIYYDIQERGNKLGTTCKGHIFVHSLWAKIAPFVTFVSVLEKFSHYSPEKDFLETS